MSLDILLAGGDLSSLVNLVIELGPTTTRSTILEVANPVTSLVQRPVADADVGIIALNGGENVAELYELFERYRHVRFILLAAAFPPAAALVRVAAKYGSVFLSRSESSVVVAATVIALTAQMRTAAK